MRLRFEGVLLACCLGCPSSDGETDSSVDSDTAPEESEFTIVEATVDASGPVTCPDPSARSEKYFDIHYFEANNPEVTEISGQAVATIDVDGDGWLDLLYPSTGAIYLNDQKSGFNQVVDRFPAVDDPQAISAVSAADYDGDGDFDLMVSFYLKPNQLWRNTGEGYFEDVSEAAGITPNSYRSQSSAWADFDRDGDLDVYIANYGLIVEFEHVSEWADFGPAHPNEFYVNNGDGTFTDASASLPGDSHYGYSFQPSWNDLDGDGWLDLYLLNDFGTSYPNAILWNREGVLEVGAPNNPSGIEVAITSMGLAVGDITYDEKPDFFITAWRDQNFLLSYEDFWVDYSAASNITWEEQNRVVGWGSWFTDLDLDGDHDVVVLYGYFCCWINPTEQPDILWLQTAPLTFEKAPKRWDFEQTASSKGLSVADLNKDGWPDIAVGVVSQQHRAHVSRCGTESWLRFSVEQPGMNRHGIGTRVRVVSGDTVRTDWIRSGGQGFASGGAPEVMFGFGNLEQVDSVEIFWPDGGVTELGAVTTRQSIKVVRESMPYQSGE